MVDRTESERTIAADNGVSSQPHAQRGTVKCSGGSGNLAQATGASPSNTAPSNYTGVQILHQGVDSLYLIYAGSLTEKHDAQLELLKSLSQSLEPDNQSDATLWVADHGLYVHPRGRGRFPFVVSDNWYQIQLSRRSADKLPLAYVQIASELLTLAGVKSSVNALNNMISVLAGKVVHPTLSRVDLCVDFVCSQDWEAIPRSHWITRALRHGQFYEQDQFTGLTFGLGGAISCRLYNKTVEIRKSDKWYYHEIWKEKGWSGTCTVWRLEFQIKQEVLKQANIQTVPDLLANMDALWAYCTQQWLQLKQPQDDSNTTRWPVYPVWEALQQVDFGQGPTLPILRVRKDHSPSDRTLFVNGLGAITSFMAREGLQRIDQALEPFLEQARKYHQRQSQQTGKTLNNYVREKVEQKRTRFAARKVAENARSREGRRDHE